MDKNNTSMISKNISFLHLLLLIFFCSGFINKAKTREININGISKEEDLELERQLKILNKHPVQTFQSKEGVTIDCIKINQQPSLDHPLLKNHKIQMLPNSFPKGVQVNNSAILHSSKRTCPIGTVPIQRTTKQDLIRAKSFWKLQMSKSNASSTPNIFYPDHKIVKVRTRYIPNRYFGAKAGVSISSLSLQNDQSSSSNLWIQSGNPENLEVMSAGLMVSKELHGDDDVHLFTFWTNDAYKTGCYNLLCQAFVQVHPTMSPGCPVNSELTFGTQKIIVFTIYQDGPQGNWWLVMEIKPISQITVGYWPSELFPFMRNGTNHVGWGGATRAGRNGIWAPMGNGVMPDGDYTHSAFFNDLHFIDDLLIPQVPQDNETVDIVESPNCYALVKTKKEETEGGYILTFGGPGGYSC